MRRSEIRNTPAIHYHAEIVTDGPWKEIREGVRDTEWETRKIIEMLPHLKKISFFLNYEHRFKILVSKQVTSIMEHFDLSYWF